MFDFLKGGKVDCTITLDRDAYYPGETVQARVQLSPSKEMKIQKGVIRLLCRQEYKVSRTEREHDSDSGSHLTTRDVTVQRESVFGEQVFIEAGALPAGAPQTVQFATALPAQAQPTWAWGNLVHTAWVVKMTLDRKMAMDFNAEQEFTLIVPPEQPASGGEGGQVNKPQEVDLALYLPAWQGFLGETLSGELRISPYKTVDVNEIRVELVREEQTLPDQPQPSGILQSAAKNMTTGDKSKKASETVKIKLAGKTKLTEGQEQRLPFQVPVPAGKPSSGRTDYACVTWRLRGVLDRGLLHGDYTVEQDVSIYNGHPKGAA